MPLARPKDDLPERLAKIKAYAALTTFMPAAAPVIQAAIDRIITDRLTIRHLQDEITRLKSML